MGSYGVAGGFAFGAGVLKVQGRYCPSYRGSASENLGNSGPGAVDTIQATPFIPAFDFTTDSISFRVNVAGGVGTVADIGIYSSIGNTGLPATFLASSAGILVDTVGTKTGALSLTFNQGVLYWITCVSNGAATLAGLYDSVDMCGLTNDVTTPSCDIKNAHAYGSFPSSWPYGGGTSFSNLNIAYKLHVLS